MWAGVICIDQELLVTSVWNNGMGLSLILKHWSEYLVSMYCIASVYVQCVINIEIGRNLIIVQHFKIDIWYMTERDYFGNF